MLSSLFLLFTLMLLVYLVYWLIQNDGAESISDQKGFLRMRDMEAEERKRRPRVRERVPGPGYLDNAEPDRSRFGPGKVPDRDYAEEDRLKNRPRNPDRMPKRRY